MQKNANRLWITTITLGWLLDFLFWKKPGGINFAIFTVLCLIGGFLVLLADQRRPARGALWLVPLILFFAAVTFIRAEPLTVFLGVLFTLFLCATLAITYLGGRWPEYSLADYLTRFLGLAGSLFSRPLRLNSEVRQARAASTAKPKISPWPVLRGVLIALPVLAIFASLLSSADAIFSQRLSDFVALFKLDNLPEHIFRLTYILISAYLLAGAFLHAGSQSKDERLIGEERPFVTPILGFTETAIVLGSVVILFAAFVTVQFQYFFGGQANINIEGFTYSEYARRGFGELVVVAVFSLFLILGLSAITLREQTGQRRIFSGLSIAVVGLVLVMLVSAYQRLALYETAYGFSRLRTYTHVFLVWIGLLLMAVVVLEFLHRERAFAAAALIASLGFGLSLSALNVDGFIVRQNLNRAEQGKGLDVPYLVSLSTDSVGVLAAQFQSASLPGLTRDAVGAVLFCRLQADSTGAVADWRSFTVSRWRANRDLQQVQGALDSYRVTNRNWPVQILTPGHVQYDCFGSGND